MNVHKPLEVARVRAEELLDSAELSVLDQFRKHYNEVRDADRILRRIRQSSSTEQCRDHLAELRYANAFVRSGFSVVIEPLGRKGPDLAIRFDAQSALVEVTRFRERYSSLTELDVDDRHVILPEYGNIRRDTIKTIDKLVGKLRQVSEGESIIAITMAIWKTLRFNRRFSIFAEQLRLAMLRRQQACVWLSTALHRAGPACQLSRAFQFETTSHRCSKKWCIESTVHGSARVRRRGNPRELKLTAQLPHLRPHFLIARVRVDRGQQWTSVPQPFAPGPSRSCGRLLSGPRCHFSL